jgi:hypothetical protein
MAKDPHRSHTLGGGWGLSHVEAGLENVSAPGFARAPARELCNIGPVEGFADDFVISRSVQACGTAGTEWP